MDLIKILVMGKIFFFKSRDFISCFRGAIPFSSRRFGWVLGRVGLFISSLYPISDNTSLSC